MKATGLLALLVLGTLLSLSKTVVAGTTDPSACHCKPTINVSVDGNGQCDLCKTTDELHKEVKKLKSDLSTVKSQLSQIQPGQPGSSFDLYFTKSVTSDYVIHHGLAITNAFTTCFRMRSTDKTGGDRTVVSYSTSSKDNEILINWLARMQIVINSEARRTQVAVDDGEWHHICITWENQAGSWKLYKDGTARAAGIGLKPGYVIKTNGILVIGQEQDSFGGSFDASQNYIGELTDLNIWNRVLPAADILKLSKSCHAGRGNVKKWSDFKVGIRGDVRVVSPSACET